MTHVPLHSQQRGLLVYFLSLGFRPFFLGAGIFAALTIPLWAVMYASGFVPAGIWPDAVVWHAHEMVFGYTAAVIGGFLLTAVPNWTKARPVRAWPLACLISLWLLGRVAMFVSASHPVLAACADLLFLPAIALSLLPSVLTARSYRNIIFFGILAFLTLCNVGIHLEMSGHALFGLDARTWLYTAVHLVALMIVIFGGRVVPMFTRNALKLKGREVNVSVPKALDVLTLAASALAIPAMVFPPEWSSGTAVILLVAGAGNLGRMAYWHAAKTLKMPIVWVLHAGYFWVSLGYLAEGYALLADNGFYPVALHILTMGGIGTMTLAMMTRVSLGHTGRPLTVSGAITTAYLALQLGILVRAFGGVLLTERYVETVVFAALMWTVAFALFSLVYIPILLRPRADERS